MTTPKGTEPAEPRTLAQAQEVLAGARPDRSAPLEKWLAFYQRSAAVYAEVAEIDRGHHHESLFMAEQERKRVEKMTIAAQGELSERPEGRRWRRSQHGTDRLGVLRPRAFARIHHQVEKRRHGGVRAPRSAR